MTDPPSAPGSHYLAKDYQSFRALMLDRLAALSPTSAAAGAASLEMTLVEALAYLADNLSYYQDAVATEAYLGTARQHVSVARHARLLDYRMNEGCSARLWVCFETAADDVPVACGTVVTTSLDGTEDARLPHDFDSPLSEVFQARHDAVLTRAHNRMALAPGAPPPQPGDTQAWLAGALPRLAAGDVLILRHSPSGWAHAVRLLQRRVDGRATAIDWHDGDALPEGVPAGGSWTVSGNIVLADHGRSRFQPLPPLPARGAAPLSVYCPHLAYIVPYRHEEARRRSAVEAMRLDPGEAEPSMRLTESARFLPAGATDRRAPWTGRRELLGAGAFERSFAVEPASGGRVTLRFAEGSAERRPQALWDYKVRYRSGGGIRGNIGAGTIAHVVGGDDRILAVSNPLPATGGADPEPLDEARLRAPFAARVQRRCVTDGDYVRMTDLFPGVAASAAKRVWEAGASKVTIDVVRAADRPWDDRFAAALAEYLAAFRMIGDELLIRQANPRGTTEG